MRRGERRGEFLSGGGEWVGLQGREDIDLIGVVRLGCRATRYFMPTYVSLCRWTTQGAQNIKESPTRLDAAKKGFAAEGVKILHFFMTAGKYDMVIISEAPSDEVMAKAMLKQLAKGSLTSQTSRAFTEEEYRAIVGSL